MTVRGVKYLNDWIGKNVPPLPTRGDVLIRALAQKLRDDAATASLTIADMEIQGSQVEQFIRETISRKAELAMQALNEQRVEFLESWRAEHITAGVKQQVDGYGVPLSVELAERLIADTEKAG